MKSITIIIPFIFTFLIQSQAQSIWTEENEMDYMKAKSDSSSWDMTMLLEDIEGEKSDQWPTKPALSNYPSPVPEYHWGYVVLGNQELLIEDKVIEGKFIGYAKDEYRNHLLRDSADYYINYFNIFILTDLKEDESGSNSSVSRNYPHYLSTGKQKTSLGSIDWVQMNLADGQNFAIINQRYYNLKYGKTILIVPLDDGSIRISQIDEEIGSMTMENIFSEKESDISNPIYNYIDRMNKNQKVKQFFTQDRLLKQ